MSLLVPISYLHLFGDALVPLDNLLVQPLNLFMMQLAGQNGPEMSNLAPYSSAYFRV